jgi:hypothetical protein
MHGRGMSVMSDSDDLAKESERLCVPEDRKGLTKDKSVLMGDQVGVESCLALALYLSALALLSNSFSYLALALL